MTIYQGGPEIKPQGRRLTKQKQTSGRLAARTNTWTNEYRANWKDEIPVKVKTTQKTYKHYYKKNKIQETKKPMAARVAGDGSKGGCDLEAAAVTSHWYPEHSDKDRRNTYRKTTEKLPE